MERSSNRSVHDPGRGQPQMISRRLAVMPIAALVVLGGACSRQDHSSIQASREPPRLLPDTSPEPIALPDLSSLERSVQRQIGDRYTALAVKLQNPATAPTDLAVAYGDLARLLMAAGMNDLAVSCYLHAEAKAPEEMRWSYHL